MPSDVRKTAVFLAEYQLLPHGNEAELIRRMATDRAITGDHKSFMVMSLSKFEIS